MYNNYGPGGLLENDTRLYDLRGRSRPGTSRCKTPNMSRVCRP